MKVYPRVYGGTYLVRNCNVCVIGLSPRVRGNPNLDIRGGQRHGSIPACTGEPVADTNGSLMQMVYPRVYGGTDEDKRLPAYSAGLSPRVRGNP